MYMRNSIQPVVKAIGSTTRAIEKVLPTGIRRLHRSSTEGPQVKQPGRGRPTVAVQNKAGRAFLKARETEPAGRARHRQEIDKLPGPANGTSSSAEKLVGLADVPGKQLLPPSGVGAKVLLEEGSEAVK